MIDETTADEEENGLNHFEWDGERVDMAEAMYERAQAYGSYANKDRALPDIRDGLKPVQRRLLYSMSNGQLNVTASRPRQKCALVVGHAMGRFHPHGDSAIYGALVRMGQDFSMSIPLIDKQGNFGSVGPQAYSDPAAAMRYTEARLSKIATESLTDLHPEIVAFKPNFSEQEDEPVAIPMTFPNLLVNGGMGIGWSLASNIPTHNLIEACDAAILVAENPDATLKQIMKRMPGPDFPTGAIIVDPESLVAAYETGRGTFKVQCKYKIENVPGSTTQQQIVITELPYGVSGNQIVAEIGAKAEEEKITEVVQNEWPENQTDMNGTRVVVKTKRGGNVQKLLAELLEHTSLRTSVSINMTVLIDRTPKQVNVKEALEHFVAFRLEIVRGRLELERKLLHRELKRLLALIAANASVDEVVKIIKNSRDDDHTRAQLIKLLKFTPHGTKKAVPIDEEQAQWIMDMRLKRLNQINVKLLKEEAKQKGDRIDEITRILDSEHGVRDIVVDDLKETKKNYGVPRRTYIGGEIVQEAVGTGKSAAAIVSGPVQPVTVYIASNGNALVTDRPKKQPTSSPLKTGDANLIAAFDAVSDQSVFAFTEQGVCFKVSLADCPVERSGKGRPLIGINKGDKVIAAFVCGTAPYYTFVSEKGEIKRQPEEPLLASQSLGIVAMGIPNDDAVVAVVPMTDEDEIIISSAKGQALRVHAEKIPVKKTPSAGGVAGMKLGADDKVVAATVARGDVLLVVHETGMAKRVKLSEYPTKGRGGGGVASAAVDKPTRGDGPAGLVVAALALTTKDSPILFSDKGQFVDYEPKAVAEGTRAAVSKRAFDLGPGDAIKGVLVFADEGK